jgi:CDP-diacylglycerol--glycerol-3-phosphate 3-phosphatidyltransferase
MKKLSPRMKREFFNLPNILTYLRVAAIPFVLFFLFLSEKRLADSETASRWLCFVSFLLFGLAALTDYLDGYLARSRGQITLVGKFVDPLADKLIVLAALVALVELHRVEGWIAILIMLREISITGLRTLAMAEGLTINVIQAGKWKTAFQLCGLLALILHYDYRLPFVSDPVDFNTVGKTLIIVSLLFSFTSAATYFKGFINAINEKYEAREGQR